MYWGLASGHASSERESALWKTVTMSLWGRGRGWHREEEQAGGQSHREGLS